MSEQLKVWWATLSEREQQLSLLSAGFILLAIVYWGVWNPLTNQLQASEEQLINTQQTLTWVEEKAGILVQGGVGKKGLRSQNLTLSQLVTSSAKQYGIKFSRVENKKEQIELTIVDVEFNQLIRWLTSLSNEYFVSVTTADFSKIDPQGHIKVNRLVLSN